MDSLRKLIQSTLNEAHYTTWKKLGELGPMEFGEARVGQEKNPIEDFQGTQSEIVQKLTKHFKIGKVAPLGSGTNGFAYYIPNNKVLKVTKDRSEAAEAYKIKGNKLKHLANIYEVYALKGRFAGTYVIISELLNITDDIRDADDWLSDFFENMEGANVFTRFNTDKLWKQYQIGKIPPTAIKKTINDIHEYFEPYKAEIVEWYLKGMFAIIDELRKYGIQSTDWGVTNLGIKKNGTLAMYDLGYGDKKLPKGVQNVHLNEKEIEEGHIVPIPAPTSFEYPDFFDSLSNPTFKNRPYPMVGNLNNQPLSEDVLEEKKRVDDKTIQYLLNKMNAGNANYLKSGGYGDAYEHNGKIIKFTTDFKEAKLAVEFSKHKFKHVANIEKVVRYKEPSGEWIYIITLEKLNPISEQEVKLFRLYEKAISAYNHFVSSTGDDKNFEETLNKIDINYIAEFFDPWVIRDVKLYKEQVLDIAHQIDELKQEVSKVMPADQVKNSLSDFHPGNTGKKSDGTIAFFDLRWEYKDHPTNLKTIKETEISPEEINKKDLPYKFSNLFDDFVREKTEAEIREIAPTLDLSQKPALLMMNIETNYPDLFDSFADWIFTHEKNQTTLSEDKTKKKIYYHGRKGQVPYHGNYIFLTDDIGYAAIYSDMKIVYAYTLNFPENKIFSLRNPKHKAMLEKQIGIYAIKSILDSSRGGEMDWASLSNVGNKKYEFAEDLLQALGFKAIKLNERPNIESIYVFNQDDITLADKIDLTTKEKTKFLSNWFQTKEKEWNPDR